MSGHVIDGSSDPPKIAEGGDQIRKGSIASVDQVYKAESGSSAFGATFNLSKTIIGAGIFTMPSALQQSGFFLSIIVVILVAYLTDWTILLLVRTGLKSGIYDYAKLTRHSLGKTGSVLYTVSAFLLAYGICAAYSIIAADTVSVVTHMISGLSYEELYTTENKFVKVMTDRRVAITFVTIFLFFPLSSLSHLKHLSMFSLTGLLMFCWASITALVVAWTKLPEYLHGSKLSSDIYTFAKPQGIVGLISRCAFSSVCHHNQFMIFKSLKKRSYNTYRNVVHLSLFLSALGALLIGILGYLPLVENAVGGNILNYLPSSDIWVQLGKAAFAVDVILTYPLELLVARDLITKSVHKENEPPTYLRYIYTVALVGGIYIISLVACNLNDVIDFTGGIAASMIAFVLPPLNYIMVRRRTTTLNYTKLIPHFISMTFGFCMVVLTFVTIVPSFKIERGDCTYLTLG